MSDPHGGPPGWGQNPPSSQPPQPQQPGGWGATPQPGYGGQPPAGGHGAYGAPGGPPPPPRKSRTGLIVGLVVLLVLVVGGVVTGIVLATGGDSDDQPVSEPVSKDPSSQSSEPEPSGEQIDGTGYSYTMPTEEWQDGTSEVLAQSPGGAVDSVSIWGDSLDTARSNILVETGFAGDKATLADLRENWETNLSGSDGAVPEPIDGTTIDGEEAIGVTLERENDSGDQIGQIAYLTLHDGSLFSIAVSGPSGDGETADAFQAALSTWTWAD